MAKTVFGLRCAEPLAPRVAQPRFAGARERCPNPTPEEVPAGRDL